MTIPVATVDCPKAAPLSFCCVCGPLALPRVHTVCHRWPRTSTSYGRRNGCLCPSEAHTAGLRCRTCSTECGIDCSR